MAIPEPRSDTAPAPLGRSEIGLALEEVATPALVLDLSVVRRNLATMAARIEGLGAELRPHVKAHKCAELAVLQLEHGAIGVTTATVAEAEAMASRGVRDVFVANEVVGAGAVARLARLARATRVSVAIDDAIAAERLGRSASDAGSTLGVVVELDVGMGRGGARTIGEAVNLARTATDVPGLELRGVMGYEGHCADEPDPVARERATRASMELLLEAAERIRASGLEVEVISAGSTGTYATAGSTPGVTEVQAGSYVLMDAHHAALAPEFSLALTVAATAISVHGDLVVFDAGRKAAGGGFGPPAGPSGGRFAFMHEEHVGYRYPRGAPYRVGDRVALIPDYAPTTVNLFGSFHVVEDGRVVDVWPVRARHGDR